MKMLSPVVALAALLPGPTAWSDPIIREPNAIYLSDFDAKPLRLKVLQPAPAYFDHAFTRYVGDLRVPQTVEVQAISDTAYRVKGKARQGQILGWVETRYLEAIPAETLTALKQSEERRRTVTTLIARHEVAIGMTADEVTRSVGKPQKRTSRADSAGSTDTWDYVKYASIPQQSNVVGPNGVVSIVTTYIKTPIGRLTVSFKNGIVESLDQSEGTILNGAATTIVAPPILLGW